MACELGKAVTSEKFRFSPSDGSVEEPSHLIESSSFVQSTTNYVQNKFLLKNGPNNSKRAFKPISMPCVMLLHIRKKQH